MAGCAGPTSSSRSRASEPAESRPAASEPAASAPEPAASGVVALPPVGGRVDYQLGGAYDPPPGVTIVTRDRTDRPAKGAYDVCYVNAYQAQPGEGATWRGANADLVLRDAAGREVIDEDWGEPLLDTSTAAKRARLAAIVGAWIDGCARDGFDAVEPDNLDSWTRSHGMLTANDNLAFAELLAGRAHAAGLAIAQKNAGEISAAAHRAGMDFAVAEECEHYRECGLYTDVYGDHVIEIEYADQPKSDFTRACAARGDRISVERRDRDVVPAGHDGYLAQWC
ncbi:endo alpha-1,4 polygalactosaminidase [Microbacterium sp.]|uniref:endo alpha-1,4 polygalactosaminidase n=1 Tax=Microbacterium sp. TaxID=51671 RepID=UPI0025D0CF82|nr:endo alpha-1,4 polygalactosaminidase [Microbacterium sp.]